MLIFIWNERMERRMVLYPCKKGDKWAHFPALPLNIQPLAPHKHSLYPPEFLRRRGIPWSIFPPAPCPLGSSPSPPSLLHMQIPSGSIPTRPFWLFFGFCYFFLHGCYPQRSFSYFTSRVGMLGAAGWEGFPAADSSIPVFSAALSASRAKYRDSALS